MSTSEEEEPKRFHLCHHPNPSCTMNALQAGLQNFLTGAAVHIVVQLLKKLLSRRLPNRPPTSLKALVNHPTTKFGLFLGSFSFLYKSIHCLLRRLTQEDPKLNSFVAGGMAGLSILFLPRDDRVPISLYLFIRAMKALYDTAQAQGWVPPSLFHGHGDVALMILASCQLLFAFVAAPESLPSSYNKFLLVAGWKDERLIRAIGSLARGENFDLKPLKQFAAEKKLPFPAGPVTQGQPICSLLHPGLNCASHWVWFTTNHFWRYSLPMYAPLNLLSLLVFRRSRLLTQPLPSALHFLISCCRSAGFLALYCANCYLAVCTLRQAGLYRWWTQWLGAGILGGTAVLMEQKSRRMELALYCLSPALQSLYVVGRAGGWLPRIPNVSTTLFCLAMAVIMTAHQYGDSAMPPTMGRIAKLIMGMH